MAIVGGMGGCAESLKRLDPRGFCKWPPPRREKTGGCESAEHPKFARTAEVFCCLRILFGSGSAGFGWAKPTGPAFGRPDDKLRVPTDSVGGHASLCPPYAAAGANRSCQFAIALAALATISLGVA